MSRYMLIASRDPFTSGTVDGFYALARDLRRAGHEVTLFLVENGVLVARAAASPPALSEVLALGVTVYADDFSLRQRAIPAPALLAGIKASALDRVLDELAAGAKTIWH